MKREWRKEEKNIYLPKKEPIIIDIPNFKFLTIEGEGNPNSEYFSNCIGVLYSISYAIKMNSKKMEIPPEGYCDYTVYPLEGVWDLNEKAKQNFTGKINKDDFIYKLMIRQPGFLTSDFFEEMLALTQIKKPNNLLSKIKFEEIEEGKCVQMLHVGSYDNEPETFKIMEDFVVVNNLLRISKSHREIYLSDFRKVDIEKLKTVLRFQVKDR